MSTKNKIIIFEKTFCMKISLIVSLIVLILISACGLQYTPTETREDLSEKRKNAVSQYIRDAYKDSSVVYQSLVFAPSTLIKPYHHRLLDSLYEVKLENEQSGRFDKDLEEKINNQKNVIANSKEKIAYIEHHVYSIQTQGVSNTYYADVNFGTSDTVTGFTITQSYEFPSDLLRIFKSYITRESILYPNYGPTEEESEFYTFFDDEMSRRPLYEQNEFLTHMLNTFLIARTIRSLETQKILEQFAVIQSDNRKYDPLLDVIHSVNGVWENDQLLRYEVNFTTPKGTFIAEFNPYFEPISLKVAPASN